MRRACVRAGARRGASHRGTRVVPGGIAGRVLRRRRTGMEQWLDSERVRLRAGAARAAWGACDAAGPTAAGAMWARRAVDLAPLEDRGVRRLLTVLEKTRQRRRCHSGIRGVHRAPDARTRPRALARDHGACWQPSGSGQASRRTRPSGAPLWRRRCRRRFGGRTRRHTTARQRARRLRLRRARRPRPRVPPARG